MGTKMSGNIICYLAEVRKGREQPKIRERKNRTSEKKKKQRDINNKRGPFSFVLLTLRF